MIETAKQELASRRIREFLGAMKDLGFSGREIADLIAAAQEKEESQ